MNSSLLVLCVSFACLFGTLKAAAVDTVVPEEEKTDVTARSPAEIDEDCYQPRETGRCFALFHRYAFNVEKGKCEEFIFGGCQGNNNNFETMEQCESKCMKPAEEKKSEVETKTETASVVEHTHEEEQKVVDEADHKN